MNRLISAPRRIDIADTALAHGASFLVGDESAGEWAGVKVVW